MNWAGTELKRILKSERVQRKKKALVYLNYSNLRTQIFF